MANTAIQLKGNLKAVKAGGVLEDVSAFVSTFKIMSDREQVTIPGTLLTGRRSTKAGLRTDRLEIVFHSSTKAAEFWAELYEIIESDESEMDFEGTFNDDPVDADNPRWSGTAVLYSLETGGEVGALRQQTITLDVTDAGVTKAIA